MANRTKWGDDDDFSDEEFPVREETPIDENGFKYITEYKKNARGEKVKVTTKVKMVTEITRTNKQVFERKKWAKFGAPAAEDADESNVTIATNEDIRIESPEESEKAKPQIVASGGPGKYVPPSMRGGAGARANRGAASMDSGEREFPTLRVTNISEDTGEDDLKELFNPFGRVHRIYLAKNRETMQSRGFAFVSFYNKADAQRAMDELQGYGYDHLILKIEWAKPSTRNVQETGLGGAHMSGYGKKLAQDTTEKVSYASNLTGP
ncbi:unnamed protein product [Heterosigma akashiwo]